MTSRFTAAKKRGFSLIELLVVIAVIAVLMALIVPSTRFLSNAELEQGTELFYSKLSLARQTAIKRNRPVEVRFYYYGDPLFPGDGKEFRAIQYLLHEVDHETGNSNPIPISNVEKLPRSIIILNDAKYSTLVTAPELKGSVPVEIPPDIADAVYYSFFFLPDGSADLRDDDPGSWFFTLVEKNSLVKTNGDLPANYVVIQIEPFTGSLRRLQPRAG